MLLQCYFLDLKNVSFNNGALYLYIGFISP